MFGYGWLLLYVVILYRDMGGYAVMGCYMWLWMVIEGYRGL